MARGWVDRGSKPDPRSKPAAAPPPDPLRAAAKRERELLRRLIVAAPNPEAAAAYREREKVLRDRLAEGLTWDQRLAAARQRLESREAAVHRAEVALDCARGAASLAEQRHTQALEEEREAVDELMICETLADAAAEEAAKEEEAIAERTEELAARDRAATPVAVAPPQDLLAQLLKLSGGDRHRLLSEVAAHLGVVAVSPTPHPASPSSLGKRARGAPTGPPPAPRPPSRAAPP